MVSLIAGQESPIITRYRHHFRLRVSSALRFAKVVSAFGCLCMSRRDINLALNSARASAGRFCMSCAKAKTTRISVVKTFNKVSKSRARLQKPPPPPRHCRKSGNLMGRKRQFGKSGRIREAGGVEWHYAT
ncbi:MAG: hypothetical protein ACR2P4_05755 [Gammaproteobacteria bacterium]